MEDPVQFDILALIRQNRQRDAEKALTLTLGLPRLDLLKLINRSTKGEKMTIARALSWSEVEHFRRNVPDWVEEYSICQEFYTPESATEYCPIHDLRFGGCIGCHVCNNFYRK